MAVGVPLEPVSHLVPPVQRGRKSNGERVSRPSRRRCCGRERRASGRPARHTASRRTSIAQPRGHASRVTKRNISWRRSPWVSVWCPTRQTGAGVHLSSPSGVPSRHRPSSPSSWVRLGDGRNPFPAHLQAPTTRCRRAPLQESDAARWFSGSWHTGRVSGSQAAWAEAGGVMTKQRQRVGYLRPASRARPANSMPAGGFVI